VGDSTATAECHKTASESQVPLGGLRIGLVASAGGHLDELLKIAKPCMGGATFAVTTSDKVHAVFGGAIRTYAVNECNRQQPVRVLLLILQCIRILRRERPDVIVSTGAAVGCVMCLLAKALGAKVVWLDSITNVDRPSLSGRLVRPFADLFLVQWPQLAEGRRGVEYAGVVL
jgi:UDP-N-acetylglucosamine:LPS N-acetylglucosamine transferase